jgi:hypothetical protein
LLVKDRKEPRKSFANHCGINSSKKDSFSPLLILFFYCAFFLKNSICNGMVVVSTQLLQLLRVVEKCGHGK